MRYIVFEDSLSGHCCFVVDTTIGSDADYRFHKGENICETFELGVAVEICKDLNLKDGGSDSCSVFYDQEWEDSDGSKFGAKKWKEKSA